jgi:hypothetical protein
VYSENTHERHRIPNAEILFSDTWAEDSECPNCGRALEAGAVQCPDCRQWIGECGGSCPGCPSPRCVGGKRKAADKP